LSPVGDVASAVENALAAYSGTTAAPHEYFDHTASPWTVAADFDSIKFSADLVQRFYARY
jgi:hypothetical protein